MKQNKKTKQTIYQRTRIGWLNPITTNLYFSLFHDYSKQVHHGCSTEESFRTQTQISHERRGCERKRVVEQFYGLGCQSIQPMRTNDLPWKEQREYELYTQSMVIGVEEIEGVEMREEEIMANWDAPDLTCLDFRLFGEGKQECFYLVLFFSNLYFFSSHIFMVPNMRKVIFPNIFFPFLFKIHDSNITIGCKKNSKFRSSNLQVTLGIKNLKVKNNKDTGRSQFL